jgi:hypothetical protein
LYWLADPVLFADFGRAFDFFGLRPNQRGSNCGMPRQNSHISHRSPNNNP